MRSSSCLEAACLKLKQQELNRQNRKRKSCEDFIKQQERLRDKRKNKKSEPLAVWERYIKLRRRITKRIEKRTGKTPGQMLINCSSLMEKAMIKRLLDQAEKLSPENQWRKEQLMKSRSRCGLVYRIPNDRVVRRSFAVYGLPDLTKTESQSCCCIQNWFKSKLVAEKLEQKKLDIYNLVPHFPDVGGLQVIGKAAKLYPADDVEQGQGDSLLESPSRRNSESKPKIRLGRKI